MPWFKNVKPSVIGLSHKGMASPRTIGPDEVFEAEKDEIPQAYFDQKWVEEAQAPANKTQGQTPATGNDTPNANLDPSSATAKTGSGQYTGPEPAQGSQTSVLESSTDKEAADSGAYGGHPGDRDAKRRK